MDRRGAAEKCPCCGKEMENGVLLAPGAAVCTGFREGAPLKRGLVTPSGVEKNGGIALGRVFLMGFFAQDPPITYYCRSCRTLFTFLEGEPPLDEWENKGPGSARALIFRQGRNFILFSWKRPSVPGRPAPGPFSPFP